MDSMERLLFWLFQGTKGGPTRVQLLKLLMKKPMNLRQLALAAGLDYKTVEHHIKIMLKNTILEATGDNYGRIFFVSQSVLDEKKFIEIIKGVENERKKGKN